MNKRLATRYTLSLYIINFYTSTNVKVEINKCLYKTAALKKIYAVFSLGSEGYLTINRSILRFLKMNTHTCCIYLLTTEVTIYANYI